MPALHVLSALAGRHHGADDVTRVVEAQTDLAIGPMVLDRVSGADIGSCALRLVWPPLA